MPKISASVFDLGKNALFSAQQGINLTGRNIANVNTPGYTRRRLVQGAVSSVSNGPARVERIRDRFIDDRIHLETQNLGRQEARKEILETVEVLLEGTSKSGIGAALDAFWTGWQDVANNPAGLTERSVLLSEAKTLSFAFRQTYTGLDRMKRDIDLRIKEGMSEVRRLSDDIANLNEKIAQSEIRGLDANGLRDQRGIALKSLSNLVDVVATEGENDTLYVFTAEGRSLVVNNTAAAWDPADIADGATRGRIAGWREARSDILGYMADLETLADGIMTQVNERHAKGFDLNGNTGADFFTSTPSSLLTLNITEPNQIAAAQTAGGVPGDNRNALAIADLQNQPVLEGGLSTFGEFYNALVGGVGGDVAAARQKTAYQSDMVAQLENFRESVSGVSIDEELIHLTRFQNAYQAAAKLITTADEMMDTLMNMI